MPKEKEKNKPIKTFFSGGIRVAVWKNVHKGDTFYKVQMPQKHYKDDKEEWKNSDVLNYYECLTASELLRMAYQYCYEIVEKEYNDQKD